MGWTAWAGAIYLGAIFGARSVLVHPLEKHLMAFGIGGLVLTLVHAGTSVPQCSFDPWNAGVGTGIVAIAVLFGFYQTRGAA